MYKDMKRKWKLKQIKNMTTELLQVRRNDIEMDNREYRIKKMKVHLSFNYAKHFLETD